MPRDGLDVAPDGAYFTLCEELKRHRMYNDYFGFQDPPFTTTPNSRFFYSNDVYREALAGLRYGIGWRKGLIVMTGEVGTGKTTLLGKTMRSLEATIHPVFISYDHLTYNELLRLISRELGLPCKGEDRLATAEQLRDYLVTQHQRGHVVALLIDEAQNLSDEMFEDIRLLSNFETETEKLLQIVLTGQPELEAKLDQPNFRHLKQRIVIHCRLAPLSNAEVAPYIGVRLQEAGHTGNELFNAAAIDEIALYSDGIPRLINIICDNALLLAYAQSKNKVSVEMVREAARDLGLEKPAAISYLSAPAATESAGDDLPNLPSAAAAAQTRGRKSRPLWMTGALAMALVGIGGAGGAFYSRRVGNSLQQTPPAVDPIAKTASVSDEQAQFRASDRGGSSAAKGVEVQAITANRADSNGSAIERQEESSLGTFEVAGPFSFVRDTPRSNAKIIATLRPLSKVKVLSVSRDYFKVDTIVDGRTVHGYVHREDAFFERPGKNRQGKNQRR